MTTHLLAAEAVVRVPHHIALSIVGSDKAPFTYYKTGPAHCSSRRPSSPSLGAKLRASRKWCEAMKSGTDQPCDRYAVQGGAVCSSHGGQPPVVKKSAREHLLELQDPALRKLGRILHDLNAEAAVKARVA